MKKSFKKAIAVLLAVLMVAFSVPFTALAAPGDYEPNIDMIFGTFHSDSVTSWTDYTANSGSTFDFCGLYDAPLTYDAEAGTLTLEAAKANKAAETTSFDTLEADYTYKVGDYFTATVVLENVNQLWGMMASIKYSDNIEPAGLYSYRNGRTNVTALGTVSEAEGNSGTFSIGATSPLTDWSACSYYDGKINVMGGSTSDRSIIYPEENRIECADVNKTGEDTVDISSVNDELFANPETGDCSAGYTYEGTAIMETFVFKITDEGAITFDVADPNDEIGGFSGGYYIAKVSDGATTDKYTTYAPNGDNPGSCKMTFFGKNIHVEGEEPGPEEHKHTYDQVEVQPTCTEAGKIVYTCNNSDGLGSVGDDTYEKPSGKEALGHDYDGGEVIKGTDGEHHTVKCVRYDQCGSTQEVACTWDQTDEGTDPTYDTPGKQPTYTCNVCGQTKGGETIPALEGISVTVTAEDLGTSTINGSEVTDADVTVKVAPNSEVTLKATPKDGAKFVAWTVNGKVVSTEAEHTFTALTNITFEPVFQDAEEETFTVVFADMYGNIYNTQTVSSGTEIEVPDGPVIAGYTFSGWSLTDEEIDALTEATTIVAKYERDTAQTFTVTATGATITTPYSETQDTNTGIGYNTQVTVKAEGAKAWQIDGVTVAYGESYTFYIGSDIELTAVYDSVTATPVVAAVSVTEIGTEGALKASFLASRQMTEDTTYIRAGFVYAVNPENESLTLADVDETTVRAYYCSTASEQFALNVGRQDQTGKIVARAFLAYSDSDGATKVIYAEPQSYTYD